MNQQKLGIHSRQEVMIPTVRFVLFVPRYPEGSRVSGINTQRALIMALDGSE